MAEIEQMNLAYIEVKVADERQAAYVLSEKVGASNFKITEEGEIRVYDPQVSVQQLARVFALNDVEIFALGKKAETLEDYFLKMTAEVRG